MRKSIDGLMAIVQGELRQDAYSGHLFVFVSRRCDRVKILTWDKGGFVLVYKRLERGQFKLPPHGPVVDGRRDRRDAARDAARRDRLRPRPPARALEAPLPGGPSARSSHGQI